MSTQAKEFAIWAMLIVGAGVAVILYQHSVHTGFLLRLLSGTAAAPANGTGPAVAVTAPLAFSRFTGSWTPIGPDELNNYAQPFANPNDNGGNPFTYGWTSSIGDMLIPFEFPRPGAAYPVTDTGQTLH